MQQLGVYKETETKERLNRMKMVIRKIEILGLFCFSSYDSEKNQDQPKMIYVYFIISFKLIRI